MDIISQWICICIFLFPGTHQELLDKNGIYKKLVLRQLSKGALDKPPSMNLNVDLFENIDEEEDDVGEEVEMLIPVE